MNEHTSETFEDTPYPAERRFALIEDGHVANIIVADDWPDGIEITQLTPQPAIGWQYRDGQFIASIDVPSPGDGGGTPDNPEPPAPPAAERRITRLAFLSRFTQAERVALEIAGADNPSADMQQRQQAATIRDMMKMVNAASFIDLARADTRAGVEQLETAQLLAAGRATEILDAPIQPGELPPV